MQATPIRVSFTKPREVGRTLPANPNPLWGLVCTTPHDFADPAADDERRDTRYARNNATTGSRKAFLRPGGKRAPRVPARRLTP